MAYRTRQFRSLPPRSCLARNPGATALARKGGTPTTVVDARHPVDPPRLESRLRNLSARGSLVSNRSISSARPSLGAAFFSGSFDERQWPWQMGKVTVQPHLGWRKTRDFRASIACRFRPCPRKCRENAAFAPGNAGAARIAARAGLGAGRRRTAAAPRQGGRKCGLGASDGPTPPAAPPIRRASAALSPAGPAPTQPPGRRVPLHCGGSRIHYDRLLQFLHQ